MGSREPGSERLVISSLEDVERLRASPLRLWSLDGQIELQIMELPLCARARFESRLNELAGVCGCAESSAAGAIALIAVVFIWFQRDLPFTFQSIFTSVATVIGAALLVKLARVLTARFQMHRSLGDLARASSTSIHPDQRGAMP